MNQAQAVLAQINEHHKDGVPNLITLCHNLREDLVADGVVTHANHVGFNSPYCYDDGYPQITYYDDGSLLCVVQEGIFTATVDSE